MPDSVPIPKMSAIINVYNKAGNLRLVLAGLGRQTFTDFEAIIADDGSGPDVRAMVDEARELYRSPIHHLWHEDTGWRRTVMLNNGIRAARADYLVFFDGDCIPSKCFLEDHWNEREQGRVLLGRRVERGKDWAESLTLEKVRSGEFERMGWRGFLESLTGESKRVEDSLRMRSPFLRKLLLRKVKGMLGSNFSLWKKDITAINGFDEAYQTYGLEESDVQYRLSLIGVTGKSLRNLAVQYHIYHKQHDVPAEAHERFMKARLSRNPACKNGLVKMRE